MGGRVAGKIGGYSSGGHSDGGGIYRLLKLQSFKLFSKFVLVTGNRSYSGINENIMMATIIMGVIIAVLILIALCYLAREKYKKRQEYYINA